MKIFKKSFIWGFFLLAVIMLANRFGLPQNSKYANAELLDSNVFRYVSVSADGQALDSSNFTTYENTTYIVANGSITINFNSLKYNFSVSNSTHLELFYEYKKNIVLTRESSDDEFPNTFEEDGSTYYYAVVNDNIYIYDTQIRVNLAPTISSESGSFVTFNDDGNTRTITYIASYTLKADSPNTKFIFSTHTYNNITNTYSLSFMRPIMDFAIESPIQFTCTGLDAGEMGIVDNKLPVEHSYKLVAMKFLNNDYSEENPLFFIINYNGFVYTFKFYSKYIEQTGKDCLFVDYYDEDKSDNNDQIATQINNDQLINQVFKYIGNTSNLNYFTMRFTETGRYEIEIYDITHELNINNDNYYKTSFFIKEENERDFNNVYIISKTLDNEDNELEYIVGTSTLNYNVKTTIKNLTYYFDNDEILEDDDIVLDVRSTTFGASSNIPTTVSYTKAQIKSKLDKNGDLSFIFSEDAYYQFTLYSYKIESFTNEENQISQRKVVDKQNQIYYDYTIVKKAKTTFTIALVDEDGNQILDENNNYKPINITYEATTPYYTDTKHYTKNIISNISLSVSFAVNETPQQKTLGKTYVNNYKINYAIQGVKIEQVEVKDSENKTIDQLAVRIYGVGDITVNVTVNGETTIYMLNSEKGNNLLTFTDYGVYEFKFVDSMGTSDSETISYQQPISISSVLLITFAGIIAAFIVVFIIISRGKIKTR